MRECFEADHWDGMARTGELSVPSGKTVRTPALLPVVDPRRRTVDPARFPQFGAEALITNAYIIHGEPELRDRVREDGLHQVLEFDGVIMTDSGSFQLAEYGEIDVTSTQILEFQQEIGTDIGTPVDVPTPPEADRERAEDDIEITTARLREASRAELEGVLVNGPVQGSTYPDLRETAAERAATIDLDVYPVGGVVPLLNDYRFAEAIEATLAAKRGLGPAAPVHLFGVGHPMLFALAAAAGCDLFDSAAYAVYARDGRYLTPTGTRHLDDLRTFPCECPICVSSTPAEMLASAESDQQQALAEHNLYVSFGELRRVRQAIRSGDLFELLETRARAHPRVLDGYRTLLTATEDLEAHDPARKSTFFYVSPESADRPEVHRHRHRLNRVSQQLSGPTLLIEPSRWASEGPTDGVERAVLSGPTEGGDNGRDSVPDARALANGIPDLDPPRYETVWLFIPPFGPVPPALAHTYPLSAELPSRMDRRAFAAAVDAANRLDDLTDAELTIATRNWPDDVLGSLADSVTVIEIDEDHP